MIDKKARRLIERTIEEKLKGILLQDNVDRAVESMVMLCPLCTGYRCEECPIELKYGHPCYSISPYEEAHRECGLHLDYTIKLTLGEVHAHARKIIDWLTDTFLKDEGSES